VIWGEYDRERWSICLKTVGCRLFYHPLAGGTALALQLGHRASIDLDFFSDSDELESASRKDFYDLYFIVQRLPLEDMLARGKDKYPYVRDFGMMVLTSLADFSIAEKQIDIQTSPAVTWQTVKQFFIDEIRRIGRDWFE